MARKRKAKIESHAISVRVPRELHDRLLDASGPRGVGAEVKRRLEESFSPDPVRVHSNDKTAKLLEAVSSVASTLDVDAPWDSNQFSIDAFKAAVVVLLDQFLDDKPAEPHLMYKPGVDQAEGVGRTLALMVLGNLAKADFAQRAKSKP